MEKKQIDGIEYVLNGETECKACNKKLRWWITEDGENMEQDHSYFSLDELYGNAYSDYWFCSEDCFDKFVKKHLGEKNPPHKP